MSKNRKAAIINYVASSVWYLTALLYLSRSNSSMAVVSLCIGSTFLCVGSLLMMRSKKIKGAVVYVHGKGGNAEEAEHYKALFQDYEVIGFDYESNTPWDAQAEFRDFFKPLEQKYDSIILVANSIGAYFSIHSLKDIKIDRAFFISPVVDMEKLITDMMKWAAVTEKELQEKCVIRTDFGEDLSWKYLTWVRENAVTWNIPTAIVHGSNDNLQSTDTVKHFADLSGADFSEMENGEHWFHTEEQMAFLDAWIRNTIDKK